VLDYEIESGVARALKSNDKNVCGLSVAGEMMAIATSDDKIRFAPVSADEIA
jgi:hypothetical protein